MKRLTPAFAFILGCASCAWAAAPGPMTDLRAIRALTNTEAAQGLPVAFEATVTYYNGSARSLFVQDGDEAIFVLTRLNTKLAPVAPGDRVLVRGKTRDSFRPIVVSDDVTVLGHGAVPKALPTGFDELIRVQHDCMRVSVRGVVHAADLIGGPNTPSIYLQMLTNGGYIEADVLSSDASVLNSLLDAEVEVTGVSAALFDNKMQQTGVMLHIAAMSDVKILKRAAVSPWSLPVIPMDQVLTSYHVDYLTQRVRIHGTITYYEPGAAVVLQDGAKSLWIATQSRSDLQIGDLADASGFPDVHDGFQILTRGEIQDSHIQVPIAPLPSTWQSLTLTDSTIFGHIYDLVSIEGQVVTEVREAARDEYILSSGGHLFTAIYRHSDRNSLIPLPPMKQIPLGATVRVSGICMLEDSNTFHGQVPFDILLRSFDDITVVARPPWLDVRHLMMIVGLLLGVVVALGLCGWYVERKNRREIGSLAYLEQRRSKILEDINHSKPLAEIMERITELVSVRLNGAPCWCQVADGATLGNRPARLSAASFRTVEHPIPSRSGQPLGSMFAAFATRADPNPTENAALATAAELATLAIETSRLYTDLMHRSEFDLLTDVQNRFVMEKKLTTMIQAARQSAGVFGLIYIDLNQFKLVNDVHGHLVGDLYLQEVAQRMKRQLRPGDTLARLGGDEFAVLVPVVRSRDEVEEIAARLEFCFREPFVRDECVIHGSASVGIALYPEDAETVDTLLSAADAAMYVAKYTRRGKSRSAEALDEDDLVERDRPGPLTA
ncbi:MAG: diguanylate cyclase [Terracidiphilus sp.]